MKSMRNSISVLPRNSMILLDTHVVLWLAEAPEKLSSAAKTAISFARKESGIAIADKTLWEITYLLSSGQVTLKASMREVLTMIEHRFVVLPITAAIAERSMLLLATTPKIRQTGLSVPRL